jgi:hypothetical protein
VQLIGRKKRNRLSGQEGTGAAGGKDKEEQMHLVRRNRCIW